MAASSTERWSITDVAFLHLATKRYNEEICYGRHTGGCRPDKQHGERADNGTWANDRSPPRQQPQSWERVRYPCHVISRAQPVNTSEGRPESLSARHPKRAPQGPKTWRQCVQWGYCRTKSSQKTARVTSEIRVLLAQWDGSLSEATSSDTVHDMYARYLRHTGSQSPLRSAGRSRAVTEPP